MEEPGLVVQSSSESDASHCMERSSVSPSGGGRDPSGGLERRAPHLLASQPHGDPSFQFEFQDSGLSPALSLLPAHSTGPPFSPEFSLLQNTGLEFAPLRPSEDFSVAYDKSQDRHHASLSSEPGSLSQHPLAMTTTLAEDGSDGGSISQHSLSPGEKDPEGTHARALAPPGGTAGTNSSSASSASESSVRVSSLPGESGILAGVPRASARSQAVRRGPLPGDGGGGAAEARFAPTEERGPPDLANITTGSRDSHPDQSCHALHRELLSGAGLSRTGCEGGAGPQTGTSRVRPAGGVQTASAHPLSLGYRGVPGSGVQDFWSSGNQLDGSYLGLLPQSQSTPGVFSAPARSGTKGSSPDPGAGRADPPTGRNVAALPSLNFMEKVDAWRANQSAAGKPSLLDRLQGSASAISDPLHHVLSQQVHPDSAPSGARPDQQQQQFLPQGEALTPTASFSSSPRRGEAVGSGPASLLGRSQSHSSLSTVVGPVRTQHAATPLPSPLAALGRFSDGSLETDPGAALSPARDGRRDDPRLPGASTGPSSVVSLEVDNYAPYWTTSRPLTPPAPPAAPSARELNIEERIPLYLHNLGINQSPSTILTPFGPRGSIREPEFSPTDLLTIRGSVGTPARSAQPSEGDSPHKVEVCSLRSVDSSVSVPLSVDSLCPADPPRASGSADRPPSLTQDSLASSSLASDRHASGRHASVRHVSSSLSSVHHVSVSHTSERQPSGSHTAFLPTNNRQANSANNQHAGVSHSSSSHVSVSQTSVSQTSHSHVGASHVNVRLSDRFEASSSTMLTERTPGVRPSLTQPPEASSSARRTGADDPAGANTAPSQNHLGASTSSSSSSFRPMSRLHSDDDLLLWRRRGEAGFPDSAFTSWSGAGGPEGSFSSFHPPLWARSSSDSMLSSQRTERRDAGPSPMQPVFPPSQTADRATRQDQDSLRMPPPPSVLTAKTTRRAEPEGCSAAPPDNANVTMPTAPTAATTSTGPTAAGFEPQATPEPRTTPEPAEEPGVSEGEEPPSPAPSLSSRSSPSSLVAADPERAVLSDGNSSDSSLAVRVAKLLQSESSVTMTTSSSSAATDREDTRAREWIRLKVSGQRCEPLELDTEDRRRIEEIKRELLLHRPLQNIFSTDTESSTVSSLAGRPLRPPAPPLAPEEAPPAPPGPPGPDLESRVREIAAREGVTLPRALTPTPVSTSTSTSATPTVSPAPEPLRLTHLSRDPTPGPPPAAPPSSASGGPGSDSSRLRSERGPAGCLADQLPAPSPGVEDLAHVGLPTTLSPAPDPVAQGGIPRYREFSPLPRTTSPAAGPARPCDTREPIRGHHAPQRADTATLFRMGSSWAPAHSAAHPPQSFTPPQRLGAAPGPAPPVLLPYKPHGSEELFYIPQRKPSFSPERSGSTAESTHPGSDDAAPPHFGPGVLGTTDPGLDRGVSFRHAEGVYSKRLPRTGPGSRPPPSSRVPAGPLPSMHLHGVRRDQGTSPRHSVSDSQSEESGGVFCPMTFEMGRGTSTGRHADAHGPAPPSGSEGRRHFGRYGQSQQADGSLDQLWRRFTERRSLEEFRPTNGREAFLLESLERLLHAGGGVGAGVGPGTGRGMSTATEPEGRRSEVREAERTPKGTQEEAEDESLSPASSHSSPAEREAPRTRSSSCSSGSTVDTARLVRAFGSARVQGGLAPGSPLGRLYGAIHRQREGGGRRRRGEEEEQRTEDSPPSVRLSQSPGAESTAGSVSSAVSYALTDRGPGARKTAVRLVNRGVQAGDLEFVGHATRRHTRDVGTSFPSPSGSSSSSPFVLERGGPRGGDRRSSNPEASGKERRSKRSQSKPLPRGVSWFIAAPDQRSSEARKENRPEEWEEPRPQKGEGPLQGRGSVRFEAYGGTPPWREPLRQRQVEGDGTRRVQVVHSDPRLNQEPFFSKTTSSGLTSSGLSLQEALARRMPGFVSRSQERVRRLALQAEDRRLQTLHSADGGQRSCGPRGPPQRAPHLTGVSRRAVPRKEMVLRSKLMYEALPEVQRRRAEEKRRAEYGSYRLNAQLYNKRITSRVLGRRLAWQ